MSKTKWHTRAIYLLVALVMTLGLLMVPATQPSEVAADTSTECGCLKAWGGGVAEWSVEQAGYNGDYCAKLSGLSGAWVSYGETLNTLEAIARDKVLFNFYYPNLGSPPYAALWLDTTGDGALDAVLVKEFNIHAAEQPAARGTWVTADLTTDPADPWIWQPWGYDGLNITADPVVGGNPYTSATDYKTLSDWVSLAGWNGSTVMYVAYGFCYTLSGAQDPTYVDDIIIDGVTYGMEPCYELVPDIAKDVKGSEQTFTVYDACGPATVGTFDNWTITEKLNLYPGDVTTVAGGALGGNNNYITIRSLKPGDCAIEVDVTVPDYPKTTLSCEKKWGIIHHTILDLEVETLETPADPDLDVYNDAGTSAEFSDWVYAAFYQEPMPSTFIDEAGHAVVHWWLIEDSVNATTGVHVNEAAIDLIMSKLGDCGNYADWPLSDWPISTTDDWPFWDSAADIPATPFEAIQDVYTYVVAVDSNAADFTDFTDVVEGIIAADGDPNFDLATMNVLNDTYIKTMTDDDMPGQTRGLVQVEVTNTAEENILVVTFTEYPWNYYGENPVCIEKGKKHWGVPPPPAEVKTPQVRWAGEKIVLEKDCSDFAGTGDTAVFTIEEGCDCGSIDGLYADDTSTGRRVDTKVQADGVARCVLESEQQGESDVNLSCGDVNTGFMVYYLAFEDVVLADTDAGALIDVTTGESLVKLNPGPDTDVAVQVRGWFTSWSLPGTDREAVNLDDDPVYELPAGRYVLPDDWAAMAGDNYDLRPNWDLMDMAHLDVIESDFELGPYDTLVATTDPPGEAEAPSIGPFSTLQPWTTVELWNASAVVPADVTVDADPATAGDQNLRNTVVPDGSLDWLDCPMPQALVIFDIVSYDTVGIEIPTLSGLDKGDLEGYGYRVDISGTATGGTITSLVDTTKAWTVDALIGRTAVIVVDGVAYEVIVTDNDATSFTFTITPALTSAVASGDTYFFKVFQSPFYEVEIPSHSAIPAGGYNHDSWVTDGPYDYWTDLLIDSILADTTETPEDTTDVEVYCDNHGIAGVTIDSLVQTGSVTITATAEFPNSLKKGKYEPWTSDEITAQWGPPELNPHFMADKTEVDRDETVTFDNLTTGGTHPYTKAEWDFDADGTIDETLTGTEAEVMADVTHEYAADGVYTVRLWMTDSTPTTRYEERPDYITVGAGGYPPVDWSYAATEAGGCAISPWPARGRPELSADANPAEITISPATAELWGIYYQDLATGDWLFYIPGFTSTLTVLEPGEYYYVVVSAPCTLTIPQ